MTTDALTLLVVEDNDVDRESLRRAFRKAQVPCTLVMANDGVEALARLRAEGTGALDRPFLVLLDLAMPRMNGLELLRTLRADPQLASVVAFILTTSRRPEDIAEAYALNAAGYFVKDVVGDDGSQLVELLERYWTLAEMPGSRA
ncbi:MAG: response regulator [Myxococcales bacterium]|nr:response regulator [Myxococcales bacterium]MCB9734039.1 response regulator [Deltaproteobacteria bacterium]